MISPVYTLLYASDRHLFIDRVPSSDQGLLYLYLFPPTPLNTDSDYSKAKNVAKNVIYFLPNQVIVTIK